MEKVYSPRKSISFGFGHRRRKSQSSPRIPKSRSIDELMKFHDVACQENIEEVDESININHVSNQIDQFIALLSSRKSDDQVEIPTDVETFSRILESRIGRFCSPNPDSKFGKNEDDDLFFIEAINRMSDLVNALGKFPLSSNTTPSLNKTTLVLQRAMMFLEQEFQNLLEDSRIFPENKLVNEEHSLYSPKVVTTLNRISSTMFSSGYELECCHVYKFSRTIALCDAITTVGYEAIGIEDVQRLTWEQLEDKIMTWIKAIKLASTALFVAERKLADDIFEPATSSNIFRHLASSVTIGLIKFVDTIVLTKMSSEKLFKFLDMYEALNNLVSSVETILRDDDLLSANEKIGSACVYMFHDFENAIKSEAARTPVPGGAIHPLTRYVMNYIKYACEYKDTLEQIFQKNRILKTDDQDEKSRNLKPASSAFGEQLKTAVDLLNENLNAKSQLYRDHALTYVFLMNNERYILKKIKGSKEILQLVGDTWYRKRSTVVRQYHKSYQRETWVKLLRCLSHEGLQASGLKINKPLLKERFKSFTAMFEEIHKTQSTWVVSDEQLQSELRVSVSAMVVPAYRSFVGWFKQSLDSSRQPEKYIKYQPEDIEAMIEGLFEGNPTSMGRKK